ncbi:uncharacterized protein LOC143065317 [Mytilus galloprovincialis]|uniref:uncharacterized protein LOC143065317 n=1 Tax=Mytilus galloprovincialis TaxID=29158 RepID=UPI003F7C0252
MMYFVKMLVLMLACFAQAVPPPIPSQRCTYRVRELAEEFTSQETIPDFESYVQKDRLTGGYNLDPRMVDDFCGLFSKIVPIYENNIAALRILCNTEQERRYLEVVKHIKNVVMSFCKNETMKDVKALLTCSSNNHIAQHGYVGCLQGVIGGFTFSKPDSFNCAEDDPVSWFKSVTNSFMSCSCQFDSCAPESTKSITEMFTGHLDDACVIVKNMDIVVGK